MKKSSDRYDKIGVGYSDQRQPDQRIFRYLHEALGNAESILNVGAGTGSYEPTHVPTAAVEPSYKMIQQRRNRINVVQGVAEALPFRDASFDSSLAVLTIHHWSDLDQGLQECARSSKRAVTILTWDPDSPGFWLTQDYFPELLEVDRSIFPRMEELRSCLGSLTVTTVPIPADCVDGFLGAYWRRPEAYLQEQVRSGMSSFTRIQSFHDRLEQLRSDLESGAWHRAHGNLLAQEHIDLGYKLVTAVVR
jgi:ubiquinone/menaquinone biosynthesis C-methylase UbiE